MEKPFEKHFKNIEDPRVIGRCRYPLNEMLLVAFGSVATGGRGYQEMEDFGEDHINFLKEVYPYKSGIPNADTFRDLFNAINPKQFNEAFMAWVKEDLSDMLTTKAIAIDGKCLRGSRLKGENALTLVSAWCHENGVCIGQVATDGKSNEIKAIPELLGLIDLKGSIITLDAMGCQREIAQQILKGKGDYICCLKGNQGTLHDDVKVFFEAHAERKYQDGIFHTVTTTTKSHGREEIREYRLTSTLDFSLEVQEWPGLKSVGQVKCNRLLDGKKTEEIRYFITSLEDNIGRFSRAVRGHWGIENSLHWVLDVNFLEDECRIRQRNGAENIAIMRRIAVHKIRNAGDPKMSMSRKMRKAYGNDTFLRMILTA